MKAVDRSTVPQRLLRAPEGVEVLELGTGWVWKQADGITRVVTRDRLQMSLADAQELVAAYLRVNDGGPALALTDIGTTERGSTAAREFLAGEEGVRAHHAVAHIVPSPVARVLMTSWMRLQRPRFPVKVFAPAAVDDAIEWLKGIAASDGTT